jgi:hypothetical protein
MFGVTTSDDYRPVAWMGRYPVTVTAIIAALYLLGMFATVAAETAHLDISPLAFEARAFMHGALWQPLTCTLIQGVSFFFLFSILFFYWSGSEVERFLGRRRYLQLLGLLLLVPPVVMLIWSALGQYWPYYGSYEFTIGMFIAFATLYPNIEVFGWVTLKWLAFAGIVLGTMQNLPHHEWGRLTVLWGMCLTAFLFVRAAQGRLPVQINISRVSFRRKPKLAIVQKSSSRSVVESEDVYESVDPILDKIAKSGIGSLTASERRALDRARNRLLGKSE